MNSVLQDWVVERCSWKEQTVLLCAMRGTDAGGSAEVKALTRWLRRCVLEDAAPQKTFMRKEGTPWIQGLAERSPHLLDMLPVHFVSHLMHAFQVIAYRHPANELRGVAQAAYFELCDYLHLTPESPEAMTKRLADEIVEDSHD